MTTPVAQRIEAHVEGLDIVPNGLTVDIGTLPQVNLGGSVGVNAAVDLRPVEATAHVGLDPVRADVGLDPVTATAHVDLAPVEANAHVALEPITTDSRVHLDPLALDVGISRIPDVRAHIPAHFSFSLSLFGFRILTLQFAGEAQLVTEPYVANASERHAAVTS